MHGPCSAQGGPVIWAAPMPGGGGEARPTGLGKETGFDLPKPSSSSPHCTLLPPAYIPLVVAVPGFRSDGETEARQAHRTRGWEPLGSCWLSGNGGKKGASGEGAGRKPETIEKLYLPCARGCGCLLAPHEVLATGTPSRDPQRVAFASGPGDGAKMRPLPIHACRAALPRLPTEGEFSFSSL